MNMLYSISLCAKETKNFDGGKKSNIFQRISKRKRNETINEGGCWECVPMGFLSRCSKNKKLHIQKRK